MSGWGPAGREASVSLTFDHLGEAAELEHGTWPSDAEVGRHGSVHSILPDVLHRLELHGVHATFFAEAWNTQYYRGAMAEVVERGHEIACHSFRHENWEHLALEDIDDILTRSLEAYRSAGLTVTGVRPPGGIPPVGYDEVLRAHGLRYVSVADDDWGAEAGLAHVPFQWRAIDGAYYTSQFAKLRVPPGEGAVSVDEMLAAWDRVVEDAISAGGHVSFIFHLPWQDSDDRVGAVERFAAAISADDRLWVAPAGAVAEWMLASPSAYPYEDPETPRRAWTPEEIAEASTLSPSLVASGRDS